MVVNAQAQYLRLGKGDLFLSPLADDLVRRLMAYALHREPAQGIEQIQIGADLLGDDINYLLDNLPVGILFHGEVPLEMELPTFVEMSVKETEPGMRGNTAQNATKPAILETGHVVHVPLFIVSY